MIEFVAFNFGFKRSNTNTPVEIKDAYNAALFNSSHDSFEVQFGHGNKTRIRNKVKNAWLREFSRLKKKNRLPAGVVTREDFLAYKECNNGGKAGTGKDERR